MICLTSRLLVAQPQIANQLRHLLQHCHWLIQFQWLASVRRPLVQTFPKGPGTALGIARHAIDALVKIAAGKPTRRYTLGERVEAPKMLRDDVYVQDAVGRAETLLTSARAHVFDVVSDLWASLLDGRQPTDRQLALFTTLYPHSVGVCVDVVQLIYKAAGGAAVYQKGSLDRCLRDILTANQHVVATARTYEMAGRLLLGLEPPAVAVLIVRATGAKCLR